MMHVIPLKSLIINYVEGKERVLGRRGDYKSSGRESRGFSRRVECTSFLFVEEVESQFAALSSSSEGAAISSAQGSTLGPRKTLQAQAMKGRNNITLALFYFALSGLGT
ncbi:MAG: hypothetical protein ACREJQ_03670, partial [bacterium]